jgi:hypothetical protein
MFWLVCNLFNQNIWDDFWEGVFITRKVEKHCTTPLQKSATVVNHYRYLLIIESVQLIFKSCITKATEWT